MSERALLIDNDAFLLLAGAGAIDRTLEALGFSRNEAFRLDSLPYMIRKSKHLRKRYEPTVLARADSVCALIGPIQQRPSVGVESQLSGRVGIDPGEVILYGLLTERPCFLLASNDKRAMQTIANDQGLAEVRRSIAGRVICIEQIVRKLLEEYGHQALTQMFAPVRGGETMFRVLFTEANLASRQNFEAALEAYWGDICGAVGDGFFLRL